jgi:ABC-2 type transport system ATP-binding protein
MSIENTHSLLQVAHLTKIFKSGGFFKKQENFTAVDSIDFELKQGEILGLLGPNGAGKTTTIQMLLGLLTPTSGTVRYFGTDFHKNRSAVMQQVSFASSYLKLPDSLSIEENLHLYGKLYCLPRDILKAQIEKNLAIFGLTKIKNRLTKNLSAGQLSRLMLAKAFLPNPKIVLLDEPTAALDPDIALQVRTFILEQRKNLDISILFTSHNMAEVEHLCDRVLILKAGKIIANQTPENLAATVRSAKIVLNITHNLEKLITYLKENTILYKIDKQFIEINTDEHAIADLLSTFAQLEIKYCQISIDKPTLEDYFLEISK